MVRVCVECIHFSPKKRRLEICIRGQGIQGVVGAYDGIEHEDDLSSRCGWS